MYTYKVNLLPPKLQREGIVDFRRLAMVGGITLIVAVILGGYGTFLIQYFTMQNDLEATKQQLASLTPVVSRVEGITKERKELEAALEEYNTILKEHMTWPSDLLFDLGNIVPIDLWLVNLDVYNKPVEQQMNENKASGQKEQAGSSTATGTAKTGKQAGQAQMESGVFSKPNMITFKGFSRTVPSVGVFINNLYQLPYFKEVKLNKLNAENEGFSFDITAIVRDDI